MHSRANQRRRGDKIVPCVVCCGVDAGDADAQKRKHIRHAYRTSGPAAGDGRTWQRRNNLWQFMQIATAKMCAWARVCDDDRERASREATMRQRHRENAAEDTAVQHSATHRGREDTMISS